jgi:hypothetical protein
MDHLTLERYRNNPWLRADLEIAARRQRARVFGQFFKILFS